MSKTLSNLESNLQDYESQYQENVMKNIMPTRSNLRKLEKEKTSTITKISNLAGTSGNARKELYKHQDKAIDLDKKIAVEDKKLKEYVEKENKIIKKMTRCRKKHSTLSNRMRGGKKSIKNKRRVKYSKKKY